MTQLSPKPYALKFWYRPGTVVRALLDAGRGHAVALVVAAVFGGVQAGPVYLATEGASSTIILIGAVAGLFGLYLFGWLLRNFGRWFGGEAKQADVRTAIGWGLLPWTVLFALMMFLLNQGEDAAVINSVKPLLFVGLIYGYVLLLLSLAAALRLSVLKTFLCLVVTFLVSMFPLTLLAKLVANAMGAAS